MAYPDFVRALAAHDDGALAEYVSGLQFPAHLREAAAFAAGNPRAVVLMPRGHGKTVGAIHHVARRIGASAGRVKVGIVTATETAALQRSRAVRAIVEGDRFAEVFPWAQGGVVSRKWTEQEWTVRGAEAYAEKDATVTAGSLYGLRPGPRFDLLVADDLIGPDEANTGLQRRKASERFWSVIEPMLTPGAQVIMLGTRWNEDDLYAELAGKGWPVHLRAALAPDGTALWPSYWSAEQLAAKRNELGSAIFNLQYQNDPSGMGGNIFKRPWFQYVDRLPAGSRRAGVDLAITTKEQSDYTALVEWWEDREHNLYLVGAWRDRLDEGHRAWFTGTRDDGSLITSGKPYDTGPRLLWPMDKLPPGFAGTTERHPVSRALTGLLIESVNFQVGITTEILRNTRLPARKAYPDGDKVARARPLAARYEEGTVFHLRSAPGLAEYESEATAFPHGEHDDLVDAAVYGADLAGVEFSFTSAPW